MTAIRCLITLFAFACVSASLSRPSKKVPEPSHIALAKRKKEVGQKPGVAFLEDDLPMEAHPGTRLVDVFQLVLSEQRGESRQQLFAREQVRKDGHYNKLDMKEMARLNDKTYRNAFESALKKVVKPTSIILHNNAKTGLISMIAAKLGAYRVYAVEGDATLAHIARKIVEANGYSDRIKIVHKNLSDVTSADIPYKADIFINERVESSLVASLLPYESKIAMAKFLKKNAVMIPKVGHMYMFAIESPEERKGIRVTGPVAGFDFSRLNRLSPTAQTKPADMSNVHFRAISEMTPNYIWRFDDPETESLPMYYQSNIEIESAGILDSFVVYWDLWLDDTVKLSNNPMLGTPHAGWLKQVICSVTPRYVNTGDTLTLLIGMHVGLIQADVIKINGETIVPPEVQTSSQAL